MQELISRLTEKAGISTEQANKVLETVKDFVKEKFPMMAGAVDNLLSSTPAVTTSDTATAVIDPAAPLVEEPGILDKISDVIPGQAGQKVEDFVKGAADKAEDAFDAVKDKLSGMFGGDKK
ncbi:MAG: hypothetical protein ABIN67_05330 [Ferruginibacter sp.]